LAARVLALPRLLVALPDLLAGLVARVLAVLAGLPGLAAWVLPELIPRSLPVPSVHLPGPLAIPLPGPLAGAPAGPGRLG
jgi:hypothetical protein